MEDSEYLARLYIAELEEKLHAETARADRCHYAATFFEARYNELVDWLNEDDME